MPAPAPNVADALHKMRAAVQTPEMIGPILLSYLFTQAASQATVTAENTIEIPMTVTINLPGSKDLLASTHCGSACISVLGANIICVQVCSHDE